MAKPNIYRVIIQSGVNDDTKYQERTFYIDERDDELLWHLLRRIGVDRDVWEAQQQRRRHEEAKRQREQYEREQQYQQERRARERQADEEFRRRQQSRSGHTGSFGPGGPTYTFNAGFFDQTAFNFEEFANAFRGSDDGRRSTPPRTEHKTTGSQTHRKVELAAMAGVDWEEAKGMDPKKLLKRAQRKCHPDTGGSHEAWLNLQKLQSAMGL